VLSDRGGGGGSHSEKVLAALRITLTGKLERREEKGRERKENGGRKRQSGSASFC